MKDPKDIDYEGMLKELKFRIKESKDCSPDYQLGLLSAKAIVDKYVNGKLEEDYSC